MITSKTSKRPVRGVAILATMFVLSGPVSYQAIAQEAALRVITASSGSGNAIAALAGEYTATHPGVVIEVQQVPVGESYTQAVLSQLQAGSGADVIFTNAGYGAPESLVPLGRSGRLVDLAGRSWTASVPATAREDFGRDGAIWGVPLAMLPIGIIYNSALFGELDLELPTSYAGVLDLCAAASAQGKSALGVPGSNPYFFIQAIAAQTVYASEPDWNEKRARGEVSFADSPGWREALERYLELAEAGCFFPGFEVAGVSQLFAAMAGGDVLMAVGPTTLMGGVQNMNPDLALKMAAWPGEGAEMTRVIAFYNDTVAVNAASDQLDAAVDFVDWLAEPAQLDEYAKIAGGLSPSAVARLDFPETVEALLPYFQDGRLVTAPHFGWPGAGVRAELVRGASGMVTGQSTPADVLAAMDAAWENE